MSRDNDDSGDRERQMRFRIERHFAGRLAVRDEELLRAHLPGCASCRAYYDRHLLHAEIDPGGLPARERMGRALGFGGEPRRRRVWLGSLAVAAAAGAALLVAGPWARHPDPDSGFTARGTGPGVPHGAVAELRVFRLAKGAPPRLAVGTMKRQDELAFAVRPPGAASHVLVFGVDEHAHVYWYHPAWTDPAADPTAVALADGAGLRELPGAVAHDLDGRTLEVVALFVARPMTVPITVRAVEAAVQRRAGAGLAPVPSASEPPLLPGAQTAHVPLTVEAE